MSRKQRIWFEEKEDELHPTDSVDWQNLMKEDFTLAGKVLTLEGLTGDVDAAKADHGSKGDHASKSGPKHNENDQRREWKDLDSLHPSPDPRFP